MSTIDDLRLGDRVYVNIPGWNRGKNRKATVIGVKQKSKDCVRILYDGLNNPVTVYRLYCKLIPEGEPKYDADQGIQETIT